VKPYAVCDAETDPFSFGQSVRPFMWGYFNGRVYRRFDSTQQLVHFLRGRDEVIYAHNGGKFDWRLIENHIDPGPVKVIAGRVVEAHIGRATLRDSYSLLPASLDYITGEKKKIDYRKFAASRRAAHLSEIADYLRNDCLILHEALERFFADNGRPLTLAGATLRQWRKLGGEVPKFGPSHFDTYEAFYHGGRCEALAPGVHKGRLFFLDINGAYAHAMRDDQWHGHGIETRKVKARHYERALFHVEADAQGCFPLRDKSGLSFPHARGEYHITGRELETALTLRLCKNVKIVRAFLFDRWTNFGAYVAHFEAQRAAAKKAGDRIGDVMAKLFRNGLYGKMAANPNKYKNWYLTETGMKPDRAWLRLYPEAELVGTLTERDLWAAPLPEHQKTFYDVSLGAQITGHVRSILMRALAEVKGPIYCDTDSIVCRDPGRLKIGEKLGQWKIEAVGDEMLLAGKKLYAFHPKGSAKWKIAAKGAKLTPAAIRKLCAGGSVTYRQAAQSYGVYGVRNVKRVLRATAGKKKPPGKGAKKAPCEARLA